MHLTSNFNRIDLFQFSTISPAFYRKSKIRDFQPTTRFFTYIFEKRPEFSAHRPKKRPVFQKKVLKFCTKAQKTSLLHNADKQEICIFAKTNLNNQKDVNFAAF